MTINIDTKLANADWLKTRTWDLYVPGNGKLVETPAELAAAVAPLTVEHFLTLPAAEAMPPALKAELGFRGSRSAAP